MVGESGGPPVGGTLAMPAVATRAPSIVLQTDPEHVAQAATRIRNAFARPEAHRPLDFSNDESRSSSRVVLDVPVQMASVVMTEGFAQVIDGGTPGTVIDLSLKGLSLSHPDLFMHYFSLVTFSLPDGGSIAMLVEILWTVRETKEEFRSGGRFVGVIEPAP